MQGVRYVDCSYSGANSVLIMWLRNFWCFLGANSETQWCWPPTVGALLMKRLAHCISNVHFIQGAHIEPISAREVFTQWNPIHAKKNIKRSPAVPPSTRPMVETLLSVSDLGKP